MALYQYIQAMVDEWLRRGYKSTIGDKAKATIMRGIELGRTSSTVGPDWIADLDLFKEIASSHRMALLCKDYEWYSQFEWPEDTGKRPETYEYIWPV
jgi:hypothetical protein